jgi:hypothetical protein
MKNYISLLTAALFLIVLPGSVSAQTIAGIPPMLETQRPLAMPTSQPEARPPLPDLAKPAAAASKGQKAKKTSAKKCVASKTAAANQPKAAKSAKKKGAAPKTRSKVTASHS